MCNGPVEPAEALVMERVGGMKTALRGQDEVKKQKKRKNFQGPLNTLIQIGLPLLFLQLTLSLTSDPGESHRAP